MSFLLHYLITMLEKCCGKIDKCGAFGALLTGLLKAFDCLPHEILIAKFEKKSLKLVYFYLSSRKQRVKVCGTKGAWRELLYIVPKGAILGPMLFNIYLWNLFYFLIGTDIASYE